MITRLKAIDIGTRITIPRLSLRQETIHAYLLLMISRTLFTPFRDLEEACHQFGVDINTIIAIEETRYLNGRHPVPRAGNLHLAWQYAQNPDDHHRFINMLRVTPLVFYAILQLIENHPVFLNHSNHAQTAVEQQLAIGWGTVAMQPLWKM
jgi:hypothetical protein